MSKDTEVLLQVILIFLFCIGLAADIIPTNLGVIIGFIVPMAMWLIWSDERSDKERDNDS